ncbi:MAG: lysoplasmalogenase [Melioribacteraceae bacterium]|nr:lysoplasmalogenase [Melioribacteraceae bacterium]
MIFFVAAFLFSLILTVTGKYRNRKLFVIFKTITSLLVIIMPLIFRGDYPFPVLIILCGFIFAMIGDLLLLFPEKYFTKGLFAFLTTHLCYITGFYFLSGNLNYLVLLVMLPASFIVLNIFRIEKRELRNYILVYILISFTTIAFIYSYTEVSSGIESILILIGACLFLISDFVLAWNKFKNRFKLAEFIILTSYYAGQILISYGITIL